MQTTFGRNVSDRKSDSRRLPLTRVLDKKKRRNNLRKKKKKNPGPDVSERLSSDHLAAWASVKSSRERPFIPATQTSSITSVEDAEVPN